MEQNRKGVYKPNRQQRRMDEREQKRQDKKIRKARMDSNRSKLIEMIDAVKKKAIEVKNSTGIDKMYFCFNMNNITDSLVIKYEGSESLKESLGVKTDITLDNGQTRKNNIVIYVEVSPDNRVSIEDGKGVYLDINKDV